MTFLRHSQAPMEPCYQMGLSEIRKKAMGRAKSQQECSKQQNFFDHSICRQLSSCVGIKNKSGVFSVVEAQISTIAMNCAVPFLLYSSFCQLGSPNALHIHVKLCLTMKPQSTVTLLQTQSIMVGPWPSEQECRYFYCQLCVCVSLQCFLESKAFRGWKILGFIVLQ